MSMRIYFAGKIGLDDWRCELFGRHPGHGPLDDKGASDSADHLLDLSYTEDMGGGVVYGGPFFIADNHGCLTGDTHGAAESHVETTTGKRVGRHDIYRLSCARILRADWVFVYIDSFTAFGTFFEIGYAAANGIPVFLAISDDLHRHGDTDELWMLDKAARETCHGSATECFDAFRRHVWPWRFAPPVADFTIPTITGPGDKGGLH